MKDIVILTLGIIAILFTIVIMIFIICACIVSGKCSREEEYYRTLDPKVLDDDTKEWNIEEECPYDETFVKKETKCKKSNMK